MLTNNRKLNKKDIAIVGMSGRFPKSEDLKAFWQNLSKGVELIDFPTEEEMIKAGMSQDKIDNPEYVRADCRIEHSDSFDYSFFGYTRGEALMMGPQVRIMHEQVWSALEDAGYDPFNYNEKIGLYLAASDNLYWRIHSMIHKHPKVNYVFQNYISDRKHLATLISYNLDLKGPSFFMDTTCSSSMVAIHTACRNLLFRECAIAVAGGIRVSSNPELGFLYEKGMIGSEDGHCKPFDSSASGTVAGEGVGVVVLKRIEDAIRDKDHIYALVKASAVNNDGKGKIGYTAPSVSGQADCIRLAQRIAGVEPASISFIENHGTGTRLGDPIEIEALNEAFKGVSEAYSCPIGSVKSNIGHLDTGAGVAGFVKATLSLKHKQLPPSLHFEKANPEINFAEGPFYVNTELKNLESNDGHPLRAGVSSFGIGGTNAHVVLEAYEEEKNVSNIRPFQLIAFSAKTPDALNRYQKKVHDFLEDQIDANIGNLSFSLLKGRRKFKYSRFIVCENVADAKAQLKKELASLTKLNRTKLVFMFPGQGSQYFEMGKTLYNNYSHFKQTMDEGIAILKRQTGVDYSVVLGYQQSKETDDQRINQTIYTQAAIFLIEFALAKLLMHWGMQPSRMIGHSLGEYVAACISGVFSFEEGLLLVGKRGALMNRMAPGEMLSVGMNHKDVALILPKRLSIAAINNDSSCVVTGNEEFINAFKKTLDKSLIKYVALKTSHAFHSEMMDPILEEYKEVLEQIDFKAPTIPFISNLTGSEILAQEATNPTYWVRHLRETVNFQKGLTSLLNVDNLVCIEVGPGKTLSTFLRQHPLATDKSHSVNLLRHPKKEIDDCEVLLQALGELSSWGIAIDWDNYFAQEQVRKIPVPTYPFEITQLTTRVNPLQSIKNGKQELHEDIQNDLENDKNLAQQKVRERPVLQTSYLAPSTAMQEQLCQLWSSFLGIQKIGVQDDFFKLGGDSLKGMSLLQKIHDEFNVELSIQDLYQKTTIEMIEREILLAQRLAKMQKVDKPVNRIKI